MLCFFLLIIIVLLKIIPFYNLQLFCIFALELAFIKMVKLIKLNV